VTARTYLFVPGDRAEMLDKAPLRGADAVICDLEDAVASDRKQVARETVAAWLDRAPNAGCEVWIRTNAETAAADIDAVLGRTVTGIVVAKAGPQLVAEVDEALTTAEARLGLLAGSIAVMPIIESASAVLDMRAIAGGPRVQRLAAGEADLTSELGMAPDMDDGLLPLRVQLVVTSAAAGIAPPVGPVETDFRDLQGLRASTVRLARMGFRARAAIHPAQVRVINEALTPSQDEVRHARSVVDRLADAGGGATTDDAGRLIDQAVLKGARDVLARAAMAGLQAPEEGR
jgi:citrate lyase subunit beta / citryl-CoA lyase